MYTDIQRICERPTDEDRAWFPDIAGKPWLPTLDQAMRNYKDESFIGQFLSPKLMRDFRLFAISDDDRQPTLEVSAIHDEMGYRRVRGAFAPVRPGRARAQHPGLERQPARRPQPDPAPHPAQQPAAGRQCAGGAQARGPAVGFRRAPGERQRPGRGDPALERDGA
jgi:hypothetical protein